MTTLRRAGALPGASRACSLGLALLLLALTLAEAARAAEPCVPEIARIVSLQGAVQVQRAGTAVWSDASLEQPLCIGDRVRVGPLGRAALAFVDDSVLRLDQHTTLHLRGVDEQERNLLDLVLGAVYFFSHRPRALEIGTPFVNAGTEGTEFFIRVGDDFTRIIMFEGRVRAVNPQGELLLAAGEAALARAGEAPRPEIVVRPRDAVAWALYYPPILAVLAGRDALPPDLPAPLRAAAIHAADNRYAEALGTLDEVPPAARDARYWAFRAGLLLNVGRVEEAEDAIGRALELEPDAGDALAQRAIIEIVRNQPDAALASARRAVELSPDSAAARIALSYALQANFELDEAWRVLREAAEAFPEDPLVWARLAELELARGYLDRALEAAEQAAALAPGLGRTQMVLGFAHLARIDPGAARAAFARAIELEPANPLSRLGLGLARIRQSELAEGRHEIEIATALDPNHSLIRSYLGKAYFEETREDLAGEQLAIAKELDPNDPTPWFYDAIRRQATNRPVEALQDLQTSIALNDNRAVYRSRLLLDEDLAARGARLGRIYNDLGFEQLALVEGWKSVALEPGNHAAHRLLADSFAVLPRHEIARDSELLQSQLLQPLNINPVQPSLADDRLTVLSEVGPSDVGLTEFTRLFVANRAQLYADLIAGGNDTFANDLIVSGIYNNISVSAGQSHFQTDGERPNHDLRQDAYNLFGQVNLGYRTSLQTELRLIEEESGDPVLRFQPDLFITDERRQIDRYVTRLGVRHDLAPSSTVLASYMYRKDDGELDQGPAGLRIQTKETAHLGELRVLQRLPRANLTGGFGHLEGASEDQITLPTGPTPPEDSDLRHTNAYAYGDLNLPADATLTGGLSYDRFEDVGLEREQLNPKFGLTWAVSADTTLRAAAFRVLKRTLTTSQTLEPTHVAGFNQFFDDINGSDVWRYGAALDQRLGRDLFVGVEYSQRDLSVPKIDPATLRAVRVDERERIARAYSYWAPHERWALSAEYRYEQFDFDPEGSEPRRLVDVHTHRVPLEAQYFHPLGFFAGARATYVDQEVQFLDFDDNLVDGSDRFWVFDAAVGYRFPNRSGILTVQANNLFDERFNYVDVDAFRVDLHRGRVVFGRLTLVF